MSLTKVRQGTVRLLQAFDPSDTTGQSWTEIAGEGYAPLPVAYTMNLDVDWGLEEPIILSNVEFGPAGSDWGVVVALGLFDSDNRFLLWYDLKSVTTGDVIRVGPTRNLAVNTVHWGDARLLLRRIAPESVALAVWSPPYHVGKEYEREQSYEDWLDLLSTVIRQHAPILKPGGFLAVNIADILCFPDPALPRIQAEVRSRQTGITREQVEAAQAAYPHYGKKELAALLGCSEQTIDRRRKGNNARGGKYKTQTRVFLVGGRLELAAFDAGLTLYDRRVWVKDPAWENSRWHSVSYRAVDEFEYIYIFWKPGPTVVDRNRLTPDEWAAWGSRAVWRIPSVRANDDHEAKFPPEIPTRLIRMLTEENDIVLDCFAGSGTTLAAAVAEGRQFIGIELLDNYVELARQTVEAARLQPRLL